MTSSIHIIGHVYIFPQLVPMENIKSSPGPRADS